MNKFDEQMSKIINGIENGGEVPSVEESEAPMPVVYEAKGSALVETGHFNNADIQADYVHVRSNLYGLMGNANAGIEMMLKFAKDYENPKFLADAASMMETSARLSRDLLSLQKNIINDANAADKENKKKPPPVNATQHNHYYGDKNKPPEKSVDEVLDGLEDETETSTKTT